MIKQLILASQSPQRKRILKDMGIRFQAIPAHIDEHHSGYVKPHAIVKSIALRKAMAIAGKHPKKWVLGCDTIVVHSDGRLSLKPKNRKAAKATLQKYSGSYCDVYSGLALVNNIANKKFVQFEKTRLYFKYFSDQEIEQYLCSEEWKHSSGSMTIEGRAGEWVKKIEGDYWNVVGLPVELLKEFLTKAGNYLSS